MLSIIILYHKKLELRKRFKFRSAALWKQEEYEVTLFGSERITKRRVRTEMSLLVLPLLPADRALARALIMLRGAADLG